MTTKLSGTYVQITREEFEDWLDNDLHLRGKWEIKDGTKGVYLVPLSKKVAVQINSTIGSRDSAMNRARASMSVWLVSRINGRALNKKAMGQRYFKRTKNWRETWKEGFNRVKNVYFKNPSFYDKIADRDRYIRTYLERIEAIPNWQDDPVLKKAHDTLKNGDVLWDRTEKRIDKAYRDWKKRSARPPYNIEKTLKILRQTYANARLARDREAMQFLHDLATNVIKVGKPLTPQQRAKAQEILDWYGPR